MIGRLRGVLIEKKPPYLLLDVAGIGYEIDASMNTFYKLPELGKEVTIYTHFVVREDAQLLYGFADAAEKALFRALIKVNGVGPKMALTIVSSITADNFIQCVNNHDITSLVRLPGVGKKTAERLVIEMKDRLQDWQQDSNIELSQQTSDLSSPNTMQEAISALIALGYKPQDASKAISKIYKDDLTCEQLIRDALQGIAA